MIQSRFLACVIFKTNFRASEKFFGLTRLRSLRKALIVEKASFEEAVAKAMKEVGPDLTYSSILVYYCYQRKRISKIQIWVMRSEGRQA